MVSLSAVRTGLATRLAAVTTFRQTYPTWPDQVVFPCAIVMPQAANWREALAGAPMFVMEVTILMCPWEDRGPGRAQDALDAILDDGGAQSVHAAIRADKTLGGAVDTCDVEGFTDYGPLEIMNGVHYLGCKLLVSVWAS